MFNSSEKKLQKIFLCSNVNWFRELYNCSNCQKTRQIYVLNQETFQSGTYRVFNFWKKLLVMLSLSVDLISFNNFRLWVGVVIDWFGYNNGNRFSIVNSSQKLEAISSILTSNILIVSNQTKPAHYTVLQLFLICFTTNTAQHPTIIENSKKTF